MQGNYAYRCGSGSRNRYTNAYVYFIYIQYEPIERGYYYCFYLFIYFFLSFSFPSPRPYSICYSPRVRRFVCAKGCAVVPSRSGRPSRTQRNRFPTILPSSPPVVTAVVRWSAHRYQSIPRTPFLSYPPRPIMSSAIRLGP